MAKELPEIMTCVQCRKQGYEEMCIVGAIKPLTKVQADEIIRRCKAYEGLVALLKEFRNCEICKYGRENMPFKKDEHWHKHCEFCESGEDNNWELAEQALSEEKQDD